MTTDNDRIEKRIILKASRERVWRALTDSKEFGDWFGVRLDQPFTAGAVMRGFIVPTRVDAAVAESQKKYEGMPFDFTIDRIEPQRLFSFRWHPFSVEANVDYSGEPTTLVLFELHDAPQGIELRVTESGFEHIPLARRARAFAANDGGWGACMRLIESYLAQNQ